MDILNIVYTAGCSSPTFRVSFKKHDRYTSNIHMSFCFHIMNLLITYNLYSKLACIIVITL